VYSVQILSIAFNVIQTVIEENFLTDKNQKCTHKHPRAVRLRYLQNAYSCSLFHQLISTRKVGQTLVCN